MVALVPAMPCTTTVLSISTLEEMEMDNKISPALNSGPVPTSIVLTSGLNPGEGSTFNSYVCGDSAGNEKVPSWPAKTTTVVAVVGHEGCEAAPCAASLSLTAAPGIGAPGWSITRPEIRTLFCPLAKPARTTNIPAAAIRLQLVTHYSSKYFLINITVAAN